MEVVSINIPSLLTIKKTDGTSVPTTEIESRLLPFYLTPSSLLQAGLVNFSNSKGGYITLSKKKRIYDKEYTEANKNDPHDTHEIDSTLIKLENKRKAGIEEETFDTALWGPAGELNVQGVYDVNATLDNSRDIRYFSKLNTYFKALSAEEKTTSTIISDITVVPTRDGAVGLLKPLLDGIGDIIDTVDDFYKGIDNEKIKLLVSQRFLTWYKLILTITNGKSTYYTDPLTNQNTGNVEIAGIEVLVSKELGKGHNVNGKRIKKAAGEEFPAGTIDLTKINGILTTLECSGAEQGSFNSLTELIK